MFGTVARYRLKPGHKEEFLKGMTSFDENPPSGWAYHTIYESTADPNELWLSVVFENEEEYRKNASSPTWTASSARCSNTSTESRSGTTAA